MTLVGCAIGVWILGTLLFIYIFCIRRKSGPKGDVEVHPRRMESGLEQAPALTQPVLAVAPAKPKPVKISYEQWRKHYDGKSEERREWLQRKKAELAALRIKQGRNAGLVVAPISPLRVNNPRR
jgi:hypothetical protein